MKKVYPVAPLRILWLAILILVLAFPSAICFIISFIDKEDYILKRILGIIVGIISIIEIYLEIRKGDLFKEKELYVYPDKTIIFCKLQHEVRVAYTEIETIYLVATNHDSKDQSRFGIFVTMPYLVIVCKNEEKQMINLYYYTKKQSATIIDEIRERAKRQGNFLAISNGNDMIFEFIKANH